jgi:hypothetical protein
LDEWSAELADRSAVLDEPSANTVPAHRSLPINQQGSPTAQQDPQGSQVDWLTAQQDPQGNHVDWLTAQQYPLNSQQGSMTDQQGSLTTHQG